MMMWGGQIMSFDIICPPWRHQFFFSLPPLGLTFLVLFLSSGWFCWLLFGCFLVWFKFPNTQELCLKPKEGTPMFLKWATSRKKQENYKKHGMCSFSFVSLHIFFFRQVKKQPSLPQHPVTLSVTSNKFWFCLGWVPSSKFVHHPCMGKSYKKDVFLFWFFFPTFRLLSPQKLVCLCSPTPNNSLSTNNNHSSTQQTNKRHQLWFFCFFFHRPSFHNKSHKGFDRVIRGTVSLVVGSSERQEGDFHSEQEG